MIKLNASYSKKVPAEQEYSSQSFLACIEVELPTGATAKELQSKIHDTFELVKQSVEAEIASKTTRGSGRTEEPVLLSSGQLKYIQDLGKAKKLRLVDLNEEVNRMYGVASIHELTMKDASRFLEHLMQRAA